MEELVEVFPNEMMASFWAGILQQEGILSVVKPQMGGYGMWGRDSFIPHALYVRPEHAARAQALLAESDETKEPHS